MSHDIGNFLAINKIGDEESVVQSYVDFASFPAVGREGIVYADESTTPNEAYRWDATIPDYVQIGGGGGTSTFTSLQSVGTSTTELALTATNQNYILPDVLQEGDLLEVEHRYTTTVESSVFWIRAKASTTQRAFPWTSINEGLHHFTFPAILTNTVQIRQNTTSSNSRVLSVRVWRDTENGFVVPTGTTVLIQRSRPSRFVCLHYLGSCYHNRAYIIFYLLIRIFHRVL